MEELNVHQGKARALAVVQIEVTNKQGSFTNVERCSWSWNASSRVTNRTGTGSGRCRPWRTCSTGRVASDHVRPAPTDPQNVVGDPDATFSPPASCGTASVADPSTEGRGARKPSPVPDSHPVSDEAGRGVGGTEPHQRSPGRRVRRLDLPGHRPSRRSRPIRPRSGLPRRGASPTPLSHRSRRNPAESPKRSGGILRPPRTGRPPRARRTAQQTVRKTLWPLRGRQGAVGTGEVGPRVPGQEAGQGRQQAHEPEQVELADAEKRQRSADAAEAGVAGGAAEGGRERSAGYPVLAALVAATLVRSGLAVFFKLRHSEATELTSNAALVDVATTAEVKQAMSDAAERLFSIDYNDMARERNGPPNSCSAVRRSKALMTP